MKLIVNPYTHVIAHIGVYAEEREDGIFNGDVVFPTSAGYVIVDLEEIPSDVKIESHCYTEEDGFYPNVDYTPSSEIVRLSAELEEVQSESAALLLALIDGGVL